MVGHRGWLVCPQDWGDTHVGWILVPGEPQALPFSCSIHVYQSSDNIRNRKNSMKMQHAAAVMCIL